MMSFPRDDCGGGGGSSSTMTAAPPQQQHHHVVPSLSTHSSLSELNNPNAIQLHGLLPETGAAVVPAPFTTAPTSSSPAHCHPSVLNSNNSGHSTSSPIPLSQQLQPVFVGATSSTSILSSSSPDPQQLHRTAAITPFTTCPPLAHRAPPPVPGYLAFPHSSAGHGSGGIPSPLQQHQQQQLHLLSAGANAAAPEGLVPFTAPATAPPPLPSTGAVGTPTTATTTSLSALAGLDDLQQAHERPFRFNVLPPPPPFEEFLMLWETNASDRRASGATTMGEDTSSNSITHQQQQGIAHGGGHRSSGAAPAMERGNVEAVLRASTSERAEDDGAAPCTAAAAVNLPDNTRIRGESTQSTPEPSAMVAQYRKILERWWAYTVLFASKPEVRERLGNPHLCPSFTDAQQAVAAAVSPIPATAADAFTAEKVVLQAWSTLLLQWWEETKQRCRPRQSRHGALHRGAPPTRMDSDGVDSTRSPNETRDTASSESVNSYELPSAEEGPLTRSLPPPDHDLLLHFDFTIQSASSSPTDSLPL
ncbi:hypothetical protein, unknown function [Leishmania mexicana MHOM/GT/2001/U1103]|uniref:Uncharacterized protein n=1 Tax=Leishmania mexicana (strain MHOM/GT/2001/U1103) TaxID=929439 RepID=E9AQ73_LEIMU|nr:hypothetical protein, unknown function [Leishmania mexicana MHOM/GT/2001/U1103]CBZ25092.1 hypothetical protein, unknown function [Leishmania mexicana MHOM/GT/2001/U1103]